MRKMLSVMMAAAIAGSLLAGCSSSTTETTAAASSAEETKAASGDAQKLVLSTYGLSEDISEEEVYTPFENERTDNHGTRKTHG